MDNDATQTNESHACSDGIDANAGMIIPKSDKKDVGAAVTETGGDQTHDNMTMNSDIASNSPELANSNNQNATSALEDDGPFCETVNVVLKEFENDFPQETATNQSSSQPAGATGQDVEPNTNESNNTNASSCEDLAQDFDEVNQPATSTGLSDMAGAASSSVKRRRRSKRRSSVVRQKNSSSSARRRKRSFSASAPNNRQRSSSGQRSFSKRRRSRN